MGEVGVVDTSGLGEYEALGVEIAEVSPSTDSRGLGVGVVSSLGFVGINITEARGAAISAEVGKLAIEVANSSLLAECPVLMLVIAGESAVVERLLWL